MRIIISLILLLTTIVGASAASATIDKVWLEHGKQVNGRKVIYIHTKISNIIGLKGRKPYLGFWVKDKNNNWHPVNGTASSKTGVKYFYSYVDVPYDNTKYDDYSFYIPIDDLNLSSGSNSYSFVVTFSDPNGNIIAQKETESFIGTGHRNNNHNNNKRHKPSNPTKSKPKDPNIVREWVEYNKRYPISSHTIFKDGKHVEINYRECTACHGSQKCNSCHGSGKCVSCHGSGRHLFGSSCFFCNGTGLCSICEGAGNCSCTSRGNPYPGYSWARTKWIYADGTVEILTPEILEQNYKNGQHTNNNSNYNTNPNSNSRSSNELTCPSCNGSGKCSQCAGRGFKIYPSGELYECDWCNGTGRCLMTKGGCGGSGTIRL